MALDTEAGAYDHISGLDKGTLTLNFTTAESITAGTPYIIKWATGDNIVDPVFTNVTIDKWTHPVETRDTKVTFKGTYTNQSFDDEDKYTLFLGGENTLYWPQPGKDPDTNETVYPSIGACRAYFQIKELIEGEEEDVKVFNINFGDGSQTSIENVQCSMVNGQSGSLYDLNGRKLQGKPSQKGIYIKDGKKVVVK
ncbi:MAG: hypothetical protein K5945_09090 [Bacteroidaceae bacterium]|nr:hypothetical protein [Bacteroidaceae bacterium]